jgi:hypothetical protein
MPDEPQKPDTNGKVEPSTEPATDGKSGDGQGAAAPGKDAQVATAEAPTLSEDEKKWLELHKRYGDKVTPKQLVAYAQKGWEVTEAERQAAAEKPREAPPKDAEGDEPAEPQYVTREEYEQMKKEMTRAIRVGDGVTTNQIRLDAMMGAASELQGDAYGRKIVQDEVYRLMANGKPVDEAFNAAREEHKEYLAKQVREQNKKKIEAQAAIGESKAGTEPPGAPMPEFEHKASDFQDGTAMKQAMAMIAHDYGKQ